MDHHCFFTYTNIYLSQGWASKTGDAHFEQQRQEADAPTNVKETEEFFFGLMQRIGDEMQIATGALSILSPNPRILDLCMAPGGYTASALKVNPDATAIGVTLPVVVGGHEVLLKWSRRIRVNYTDITMEAAEMGITDIPSEHPDFSKFETEPLLPIGSQFDLIFCDGRVLRNHAEHRHPDREPVEAIRLTCSQLIIAIQHLNPGGTMIMLLHRAEGWDAMELVCYFDRFSDVRLFKPTKGHRSRSSFYMVAKNVRSDQAEALVAKELWVQRWKNATYQHKRPHLPEQQELAAMLEVFGKRLIDLAEPVWKIQRKGIEDSKWYQALGEVTEAVQEPPSTQDDGAVDEKGPATTDEHR